MQVDSGNNFISITDNQVQPFLMWNKYVYIDIVWYYMTKDDAQRKYTWSQTYHWVVGNAVRDFAWLPRCSIVVSNITMVYIDHVTTIGQSDIISSAHWMHRSVEASIQLDLGLPCNLVCDWYATHTGVHPDIRHDTSPGNQWWLFVLTSLL